MTLEEIKQALDDGKKVFWANKSYEVIKDSVDQYLIICRLNDNCIGLTWRDGVTLNGKPEQFFVDIPHTKDSDCIVNPDTGCCSLCGVDHSAQCPDCQGRGFHNPNCPRDSSTIWECSQCGQLVDCNQPNDPIINENEPVLCPNCGVGTIGRFVTD